MINTSRCTVCRYGVQLDRQGCHVTGLGPDGGKNVVLHELSETDVRHGLDAQLSTSILAFSPLPLEQAADRHFATTGDFWHVVLSEGVHARRTVILHEVLLSEWFPRSPGLYLTESAAAARKEAQQHEITLSEEQQSIFKATQPLDPVVYDLCGKLDMLETGLGCIRLNRRLTPDGPLWFMSASSSLSAEEGVPLALTDDGYDRVIDYISEWGVFPCTVTGKLSVLPESLLCLYQEYTGVPRLFLLVDEIISVRDMPRPQRETPTANVAVMFGHDESFWRKVDAAYVGFTPGRKGNLTQRLPWLEYYIGELHHGVVITDFDEQMTRFPNAVFSLQKIANGTMLESELTSVSEYLPDGHDAQIQQLLSQQQVFINRLEVGEVHMGDTFKDIAAGVVIVNRSTLTDALNVVRSEQNTEAAAVLQQLADAIEQSGSPEAIDSLNGLTEELQKPQISQNRIKIWLDAIVVALPDVARVTEAVGKAVQVFL